MKDADNSDTAGQPSNVARVSALAVAALGLAVIFGWLTGIEELMSVGVGAATMKFNTAACFLLSGSALWFATTTRLQAWRCVPCAAVAVITLIEAAEYLFGVDLAIDQLVLVDPYTPPDQGPGRMSLVTALSFALFALALMLLSRRGVARWRRIGFSTLALVGLALSGTALIGYAFGTPVLNQPAPWASIAFHTAVGFIVLFIGLFAHAGRVGPAALLTSSGAGSVLARRMLPPLILVTTLIGWLFATRDPFGPDVPRLELAVLTIVVMATLGVILWSTGTRANALDRERLRSLASLEASEARLRESEARHRTVVDLIAVGIWIEREGSIVFANPHLAQMIGAASAETLLGTPAADLFDDAADGATNGTEAPSRDPAQGDAADRRRSQIAVRRLRTPDERPLIVELQAIDYPDSAARHTMCICRDVTAQHAAEAQLRQSQKMEAVGQLTGGVAHDFNNLLTVVIGNLEIVLDDLPEDQQRPIVAAMKAAERGAALNHRLLAFSRQQPLKPQRIALNELVAGMEDLIRRTLGETIEIEFRLEDPLPTAHADAGALENVLLNFVVNARDAMPGGGHLTVETGAIHLDADYAARNAEVTPGDYVMLSVSDTGTGMPAEVIERAFDPFFTTKAQGKGTGLGLSMAYGFAKQSSGHLKIYSEPGIGTSIRLYLPRNEGASIPAGSITAAAGAAATRGGETILLVEDDEEVSAVAANQLTTLGYKVLVAANAAEARQFLASGAAVDLLFTDLVMPGGVTGQQLAEEAGEVQPGIGVLFTSGYSRTAIGKASQLDAGAQFLPKPYHQRDLAAAVRAALAARGTSDTAD